MYANQCKYDHNSQNKSVIFHASQSVLVGFEEAHVSTEFSEQSTNYQNVCVILYEPEEVDPLTNILLSIEVLPDNKISKLNL